MWRSGAFFYMYEPAAGPGATIGYPYSPALPIVTSPFAWIGDHFDLTDTLKWPVSHPTMFLLFGPLVAVLAIAPLCASAGRLLQGRVAPARIIATQWALTIATAAISVVYLHPEDAIACAFLIGSARSSAEGRWRRAALLIAGAILFKQWAAIPSVVILATVPAGERRRFAFYAYAVPVLCMLPFVLAVPHATIEAMTGAQASIALGHRQLWTSAFFHSDLVSATPLRLLWLALALAVAWVVRGRPTLLALLGGLGAVMLARIVCEPTTFAYYICPALVFALLCATLLGMPLGLRTVCALALQFWWSCHVVPELLWWLALGAGVAYVCAPLWVALRLEQTSSPAPPAPRPALA